MKTGRRGLVRMQVVYTEYMYLYVLQVLNGLRLWLGSPPIVVNALYDSSARNGGEGAGGLYYTSLENI